MQKQSEWPRGDRGSVKVETPNGTVRASGDRASDSSIDRVRREPNSPNGHVPLQGK